MADIGLTPEAYKGIGPASQPSCRPIDQDTPLTGPLFWQTGGVQNDNDRQARFQTGGQYWAQQPAEGQGPDHYEPQYTPSSDITGSNPLPGAEQIGRQGGNINPNTGLPVMGMQPAVDNC